MRGRLATRSLRCESSKKYDNTKLERVQLQDECTPVKVQVLHHEDVALRPDLEMIPEVVFHLFMRLGACKM
jgi:hypothetical protein